MQNSLKTMVNTASCSLQEDPSFAKSSTDYRMQNQVPFLELLLVPAVIGTTGDSSWSERILQKAFLSQFLNTERERKNNKDQLQGAAPMFTESNIPGYIPALWRESFTQRRLVKRISMQQDYPHTQFSQLIKQYLSACRFLKSQYLSL